jgi:hypothetical protein
VPICEQVKKCSDRFTCDSAPGYIICVPSSFLSSFVLGKVNLFCSVLRGEEK